MKGNAYYSISLLMDCSLVSPYGPTAEKKNGVYITLAHSERPNFYGVLPVLSAVGLNSKSSGNWIYVYYTGN